MLIESMIEVIEGTEVLMKICKGVGDMAVVRLLIETYIGGSASLERKGSRELHLSEE
jgi:hypothetical protein